MLLTRFGGGVINNFIIVIVEELAHLGLELRLLSEALHLLELFHGEITELVDANLESGGYGVVIFDQLQVLFEDSEAGVVLLLCKVVAIVLCHECLESLEVILGDLDILKQTCLVLWGRRARAEESC